MQELSATEVEQVSGGSSAMGGVIGSSAQATPLGGGVRVGSDGANNSVGNTSVTSLGGRIDPGGALQALGGRVDPGGANN
jgi:hypothetical protein